MNLRDYITKAHEAQVSAEGAFQKYNKMAPDETHREERDRALREAELHTQRANAYSLLSLVAIEAHHLGTGFLGSILDTNLMKIVENAEKAEKSRENNKR